MDEHKADPAYDFNPDPAWHEYVATFEPVIRTVAQKYCVSDEALQEDCAQEARIALATVRPERVSGYMKEGQTEEAREAALQRYLRNVIRNAVLSYLDSYSKGNWYIGRSRSVRDARTGLSHRIYFPPRFSSLDTLVDEHGMQVDESGEISWGAASEDGLTFDSKPPWVKVNSSKKSPRWAVPGEEEAE